MKFYNVLDLVGGLAIFLFGLTMMNSNLTAFAGSKLRYLMQTLTKTKPRGYLTGLGITILNQSSSATTVLECVLVSAGLLTFAQSIPITLGAELGSTVLGQLFAFPKITNFAPLFVSAGFFSYLFAKNRRRKSLANTILGFGLLFMGMHMMSHAVEPLKTSPAFMQAMARTEKPLLGILIGLVFTMIVQSSGATSGLVIAMAIAGTISLKQAVPINLGASIGTCITAILGSLNLNREAKRTAYIHVLFQTIGVILAYILLMIPFRGEPFYLYLAKAAANLVSGSRENLARQIAMAHTLMPLLNLVVVAPALPLIVRFFNMLVPPEPEKEAFGTMYLSDTLLSEPSVALFQVRRELLRMKPILDSMLSGCRTVLETRDLDLAKSVKNQDKMIDTLRKQIVAFLTKVARQPLTEYESKLQVAYLFIASELENLGDVIEMSIIDRIKKLINKNLALSEEGLSDIFEMMRLAERNIHSVMEALENDDPALACRLVEEAQQWGKTQREYRLRHFQRLNEGIQESLETTEIHMDLLNHLQRINRHVYHIAETLAECSRMNNAAE